MHRPAERFIARAPETYSKFLSGSNRVLGNVDIDERALKWFVSGITQIIFVSVDLLYRFRKCIRYRVLLITNKKNQYIKM